MSTPWGKLDVILFSSSQTQSHKPVLSPPGRLIARSCTQVPSMKSGSQWGSSLPAALTPGEQRQAACLLSPRRSALGTGAASVWVSVLSPCQEWYLVHSGHLGEH